jgi:pimeloyl-ACP methyl ester carboxylesterase
MTLGLDRAGKGPPLVLIHGVGTNRGVWRRVLPLLAHERTVVAPDLPGFGDSPPPASGYELGEVGAALAEGLERELGEPFDLLGHSLGGAIALTLATRGPVPVRRLVLSAPAGFAPRPRTVARAAGVLARPALAARRIVGVRTAGNATARRLLLAGTVADGAALDPGAARDIYDGSLTARSLGPAVASVAAANLDAELRRLGRPYALVWGERDRVIPIATAARVAAIRPPAELVRIPGVGHVPQLERPEAFADAVRRALAAVTDS